MSRFFPKEKIVKTGNPVRSDLVTLNIDRSVALEFFQLSTTKKTVLVLGGSLGARRINELIFEKLEFFRDMGIQLLWQCGKGYIEEFKVNTSESVKVHAFINDMDKAYAAADMIISRAGAGSVSELCIVGKPTFFIPSPNVAEDHQTKNAKALENESAAILIKETDLEKEFEQRFNAVFNSEEKQIELAKNMKALALPNATNAICDEVEKLLQFNR